MSSPSTDGPPRSFKERMVNWAKQFWRTDQFEIAIIRELLISVVVVMLIVAILFGISGVWPPLVAVESDSMETQIMTGDMVFIVEPDRFAHPDAGGDIGVVPADEAETLGYERFDRYGDVIIFAPNGDRDRTPIIHRAHFWVTEGEDWYHRADEDLIRSADNCDELSHCPAPHDGFITHGDNNAFYDQVQDDSAPVKADWVIARAQLRIPVIGRIRLLFDDMFAMAFPGFGHVF